MAITALPTPPSRTDPTNFATRADAFMSALPQFVIDANATAQAMNLNSTNDTSASSVLIGTGAKTFTVSSSKSFQPGMWLVIASTAAPSTNAVYGTITSYSGTTLLLNIFSFMGSGTIAAWTISQSAPGAALASLGAAASGANTDITSLASLVSVNGGQIAGNRNRIVNGDTRIWQRGTTISGIGVVPVYATDRFMVACNGATVSATQGTGVPAGGYTSLNINGAAGVTNVQVQTRLESLNVYDLGGGQITVSGWVFQSTGAVIVNGLLRVFRANTVDSFGAVTQESTSYALPSIPNATWTFFKATFTVSSAAANGINITLDSGTPILLGQAFATTLWQCEKGSTATAFEYRDFPSELVRCMRYAEPMGIIRLEGYGNGGNGFNAAKPFKVLKRVAPTLVGQTPTTATNCTIGTLAADVYEVTAPVNVTATGAFIANVGGTFAFAEL